MATKSILNIVGNETRRRILTLLSKGPFYISQISKELDVTQPAIIRHLKILEDSGLIESFAERNPLGGARKYFQICNSFNLEIALHPEGFSVEERPEGRVCAKYLDQERILESLTDAINATGDIEEKASRAQDMITSVEILLSCEDYDEDDPKCKQCHMISNIRKQTSQIILHVSQGDLKSGLEKLTDTINKLTKIL